MAHFILTYGYNDTPLRAEKRPDHLEHLAKLKADGALVLAGPLADLSGGIIVLAADDLAAAMAAAPDAILVPKISNAEQLELIAQRMLSVHADHRTRIWAMIEYTAWGIASCWLKLPSLTGSAAGSGNPDLSLIMNQTT